MEIMFEIEVYEVDGRKFVFLSHNNSSGCKHEFHDAAELKKIIGQYCADAYSNELIDEIE